MPNTITIIKEQNNNVTVVEVGGSEYIAPSELRPFLNRATDDFVEMRNSDGSVFVTFFVSEVLKVVRQDATEVSITDVNTLYDELDQNFFFDIGGGGATGSINVVGFWNASTNTPDLSALTEDQGNSYQVSVAGSTSLNGETNWKVRDLVVWDDNLAGNWFKIDSNDDVLSVFGRLGAVVGASGDYNADQVDETASNKILTSTERTNIGDNTTHAGVTSGNPHNVAANELSGGVLSDARVQESNVTQHESAITITESQISNLQSYLLKVQHLDSFNVNDVTFLSPNPANAFSRNGHPISEHESGVDEAIVRNRVMSWDYLQGNFEVIIDWVAETAITGNIVLGVEFERIEVGITDIDSDGFASQITVVSAANGTSGVPSRATIALTQAQADSIEAGDSYRIRFERVGTNGSDNMSGKAQIISVTLRQ